MALGREHGAGHSNWRLPPTVGTYGMGTTRSEERRGHLGARWRGARWSQTRQRGNHRKEVDGRDMTQLKVTCGRSQRSVLMLGMMMWRERAAKVGAWSPVQSRSGGTQTEAKSDEQRRQGFLWVVAPTDTVPLDIQGAEPPRQPMLCCWAVHDVPTRRATRGAPSDRIRRTGDLKIAGSARSAYNTVCIS